MRPSLFLPPHTGRCCGSRTTCAATPRRSSSSRTTAPSSTSEFAGEGGGIHVIRPRTLLPPPPSPACLPACLPACRSVVTDVVHLHDKKLEYYKCVGQREGWGSQAGTHESACRGDYDTFERTRMERMRHHERQQERTELKRAHIQAFIDRFRCNANRAALVQVRVGGEAALGVAALASHAARSHTRTPPSLLPSQSRIKAVERMEVRLPAPPSPPIVQRHTHCCAACLPAGAGRPRRGPTLGARVPRPGAALGHRRAGASFVCGGGGMDGWREGGGPLSGIVVQARRSRLRVTAQCPLLPLPSPPPNDCRSRT